MDQNERQVIDGLFGKLRQVDTAAAQRDAEAERYIQEQVGRMPAAPYYMAQAILVQEQALANLQNRVQELEHDLASRPATGGGGFLSGLFGGGQPAAPAPRRPMAQVPQTIPPQYMQQQGMGSPWGGRPAGGGFLAGAMQTALGVAGGMLIADALTSAFSADPAAAAELPPEEVPQTAEDTGYEEPATEDMGGFGEEEF